MPLVGPQASGTEHQLNRTQYDVSLIKCCHAFLASMITDVHHVRGEEVQDCASRTLVDYLRNGYEEWLPKSRIMAFFVNALIHFRSDSEIAPRRRQLPSSCRRRAPTIFIGAVIFPQLHRRPEA